jgi:hypothetical protein
MTEPLTSRKENIMRLGSIMLAAALLAASGFTLLRSTAAEVAHPIPAPAVDEQAASSAATSEPDKECYPAEDYHQDFLTRHPSHPYIVFNDLPKLDELKRLFPDVYRVDPVLVAAAKASN